MTDNIRKSSSRRSIALVVLTEVLGVTESRVAQLHTTAILRLKAHLSDAAPREPVPDGAARERAPPVSSSRLRRGEEALVVRAALET
jgi:hypothetical protein